MTKCNQTGPVRTGSRRAALFAAVLCLTAGCGSDDKTATLSGKVTYDGADVEQGFIAFIGLDGSGTVTGQIAKGKYSVSGITPGKKRVQIVGGPKADAPENSTVPKGRRRGQEERSRKAETPASQGISPRATGNNQEVTVEAGKQERDFPLLSPK